MTQQIKPLAVRTASRTGVRPLMGFYSESGCGKTYSGLLLCRGFVGPQGKIVMIDTESGRGSLYADVIQGGYDVIELTEPFSPARYIEAIQLAEATATIGMIDSASHEWEGLGGVLDSAALNEEKSGKPGLHNWRGPKLEHQKFMLRLLQSSIPWVICLRAKFKTRQGKDSKTGKTEIVKDDHTTPIQADDFIFEMTAHGEIDSEHKFHLTKCSHPALRKAFPNNEPFTIEHGKLIADWCNSAGEPAPDPNDPKQLRKELWAILQPVRGTEAKWDVAEGWLQGKEILRDGEFVAKLGAERLKQIIIAAKDKLQAVPA